MAAICAPTLFGHEKGKVRTMRCKKLLVGVAVAFGVLAMAVQGQATPVNPDLTASELSIVYNGTSFSASSPESILSWTNPDGSEGGLSLGDFLLTWNGSTGSLSLVDLFSNETLTGTVMAFVPTLFTPNAGATFAMNVLLSAPGGYGLLDNVYVSLTSTDFLHGSGSGQADLTPLATPEPATLTLFGLGGAVAALRRRYRRNNA